jgi:hypothetical protein
MRLGLLVPKCHGGCRTCLPWEEDYPTVPYGTGLFFKNRPISGGLVFEIAKYRSLFLSKSSGSGFGSQRHRSRLSELAEKAAADQGTRVCNYCLLKLARCVYPTLHTCALSPLANGCMGSLATRMPC